MALGTLSTPVQESDVSDRVAELIARQPPGSALLREFYNDPPIFARDIERIHLRHWLCVGHVSRIPNAGDWYHCKPAHPEFAEGVNSRCYRPGPYGPMESQARDLATWYLEQIRPETPPLR